MDLYREQILEHWQNPQNFGEIAGADLVIEQVNPLCGDEVTFFFKFFPPRHSGEPFNKIQDKLRDARIKTERKDSGPFSIIQGEQARMTNKKDQVIADVKFSGSGCAISTASASILSEYIKGKSIKVISKITGKDVLGLLGGSVAPARLKCAFLPLEALRTAQGKLKINF